MFVSNGVHLLLKLTGLAAILIEQTIKVLYFRLGLRGIIQGEAESVLYFLPLPWPPCFMQLFMAPIQAAVQRLQSA